MEEEIKANVVYLFIVGSLSVIILILGVISILVLFQKRMLKNFREKKELEAKHQQNLLSEFIETQEAERKRIAADLHDEISASLAAAKMLLSQKVLSTDSVDEIKNIIEKTAGRAREISHNLMPPSLETIGIFKLLERFYENLNSDTLTIKYTFNNSINLSDKKQLALYRIAFELANNTIKYAEASEIIASFTKEGNLLSFFYSDNGKGYNSRETRGMGLNNIESRAQSINGIINFFSNPDSSTGITLQISLDE